MVFLDNMLSELKEKKISLHAFATEGGHRGQDGALSAFRLMVDKAKFENEEGVSQSGVCEKLDVKSDDDDAIGNVMKKITERILLLQQAGDDSSNQEEIMDEFKKVQLKYGYKAS
ncbi:hypothetical protein TrLO_g9862 [Triparma laevis f. longispina]|uniref:Uncharacterized protein n=1 Tax=Triparma laevis f. longispina TaxID=1714387 RepID=A0A9W7KST0_9STRA|nr:hypothetical protein TrLO_g9862 [Triparma laevis f. longispina]